MKYTQYDEEPSILAACAGVAVGRFLDIGAYAAETFSNVRALYERGWSGVLIEPHPGHMRGLREAYKDEPRIVLVEKAVSFDNNPVHLYVTDDATTTSDHSTYLKWRSDVKYTGEMDVEAITLEDINFQYCGFNFVNFDAEGISVDLAIRYLELGCRPECICVEHDGRVIELLQQAQKAGYKAIHTNGTNIVLAR